MIGYAKKIEKIIRESAFDKKKKKPGLTFNPGLALIRVRTTGPRAVFLRIRPQRRVTVEYTDWDEHVYTTWNSDTIYGARTRCIS